MSDRNLEGQLRRFLPLRLCVFSHEKVDVKNLEAGVLTARVSLFCVERRGPRSR